VTAWTLPRTLPDLSGARLISLDLETRDPDLKEQGPSIHRGGGYIVGIAVATEDGFREYFPIRHEEGPNLDRGAVLAWARREFGRKGQPKIGANILYDLQWLAAEGVPVEGPFLDVQFAEPLLNENLPTYSLDAIARKYLGIGKLEDDLAVACAQRGIKGNPKSWIWRLPAEVVGPYGKKDAALVLEVWARQRRALAAEGLGDLFTLECAQIPVLLAMRLRGVRVDVRAAEQLRDELADREKTDQAELDKLTGRPLNADSGPAIAAAAAALGIKLPPTESGRPSCTKAYMKTQPHRLFKLINAIRKWHRFRVTFLENAILGNAVGGRVYAQFHPLRKADADEGGEFGTVLGRYSCSNPNLQQVPKRDEEFGPKIRGLFLPEDGELWLCADYSQIEPRVALHFGSGEAADAMRAAYTANPTMDCYNALMREMPGITRDQVKVAFLGTMYGMGLRKFAATGNMTEQVAKRVRNSFLAGAPYLDALAQDAQRAAERTGWVKTILGRRRRFDLWEPDSRDFEGAPLYLSAAREKWPHATLRRTHTQVAAHHVVSGSSADALKTATVEIARSGVLDVLGAPLLTVHDELDFSVPQTPAGAAAMEEVVRIMESALRFRVPLVADVDLGPTWAGAKA